MAKIYKRTTLISGTRKKKDAKKRKRNIIINFRVSPEEKQMIEDRVKLSGMAKGEYFIQSSMHQKISVQGNVRTFDAIKESVSKLDRKLMELQSVEELDEVTLESLRMVLELLDGIYNKREEEN